MKLLRKNSLRLWIGFGVSILFTLYSLAGIAMAYWVAAVPGNTPEHIRLNFLFWIPITILCFMGNVLFIAWLVLHYKNLHT